ncbi:hypothetical protein IAG25_32590 [Caballeronia sp. EK]|uniref:hypothetical protein n=1 Tax=Caballeronia sp. EK TaxID=2767469 RepID=UPI00165644B4|nr:hypothetical protein [Caballeronia sp. EK]MBC8641563.1 hypothetical protein [Caballeronia sp. EK]
MYKFSSNEVEARNVLAGAFELAEIRVANLSVVPWTSPVTQAAPKGIFHLLVAVTVDRRNMEKALSILRSYGLLDVRVRSEEGTVEGAIMPEYYYEAPPSQGMRMFGYAVRVVSTLVFVVGTIAIVRHFA